MRGTLLFLPDVFGDDAERNDIRASFKCIVHFGLLNLQDHSPRMDASPICPIVPVMCDTLCLLLYVVTFFVMKGQD